MIDLVCQRCDGLPTLHAARQRHPRSPTLYCRRTWIALANASRPPRSTPPTRPQPGPPPHRAEGTGAGRRGPPGLGESARCGTKRRVSRGRGHAMRPTAGLHGVSCSAGAARRGRDGPARLASGAALGRADVTCAASEPHRLQVPGPPSQPAPGRGNLCGNRAAQVAGGAGGPRTPHTPPHPTTARPPARRRPGPGPRRGLGFRSVATHNGRARTAVMRPSPRSRRKNGPTGLTRPGSGNDKWGAPAPKKGGTAGHARPFVAPTETKDRR